MTRSLEDLFACALDRHRTGSLTEAEELYRQVLEKSPEHPEPLHYLGVIAYQRGQYEQAVEQIGRAIALDSRQAAFRSNLGLALQALGRREEARAAYERALELRPEYPDALSNLGLLLHECGEMGRAAACYERAVKLQPRHVDALYNWGNLLQDRGEAVAAVQRYQQALQLAPHRADIHNNLGNALLTLSRIPEAAACYRRAIALKPDYAEAHYNLGVAAAEQDRTEEAAAGFDKAVQFRRDKPLWEFRREILWPPVFQSNAEIDEYRQRLDETLDRYQSLDLRLDGDEIASCGCIPPFNLPHQGRDNLGLKRKFAAVFERGFRGREDEWLRDGRLAFGGIEEPRRSGDARPRIGLVVTRGHDLVFLKCMGEILNRLPSDSLDVVVFCAVSAIDRVRQAIHRPDVSATVLPERFPAAASTLAAAHCDVLYYWECGSDALNYFLPFLRLAPVQCTSWSTLVTSGVPELDCYLSSALVETEEADRDYSEKLVRLNSLLACQPRATLPGPVPHRSAFGLPAGKHLYVCPQNLLKFHPDFDPLLAGILDNDGDGVVVIKQGRWPRSGELLQERFRRTLPHVCDRIIMLPWQSHAAYLQLLAQADVVLDTPHYGAGSSSYDIFSFNQPLVTLPGQFNIGRYALACYRRMGIGDLIAASPDEYVQLAVRVATDLDFRQFVQSRLAERSELLFDDQRAVDEHARFFHEAASRSPG